MTTISEPASLPPADAPRLRGRRNLMLAVLVLVYSISQFLRSSTAVLAPDFARELALSAQGLSILAGSFFVTFALAQLPVGVLLDRYGPRAVMTGSILLAGAGSLLFAAGRGLGELTAGRLIMGLGCASLLIGSLAVIARWYAAGLFATMTAVLIAGANLGSLASTVPLARAAEWFGWRAVFAAIGGAALAMGILLYAAIRDAPPGHPFRNRAPETLRESLRGLGQAARRPDLWQLFFMSLMAYPVYASMLVLWAPAYLADVHGLGLSARGDALLAMVAGLIAGTMISGPADRWFHTRKWIVVAAIGCAAMLLALLAAWPALPFGAAVIALGAFSAFSGANAVLVAHGRALFPEPMIGRWLTILNTAIVGGVFLWQYLSALLVEAVTGRGGQAATGLPLEAYRACFTLHAACLVAGLLVYLTARDQRPDRH